MEHEEDSFLKILFYAPTLVIEEVLPKLSTPQKELAEKELQKRKQLDVEKE